MGTKSLLGAIVGDILHVTFSDKHFVYDWNKPLLSEKSKISGYTVITLAVARYLMESHHLYHGAKKLAYSDKRMELLAKSVLDLAERHPDLEYPVWFQSWATNGKSTKDKDSIIPTCLSPLAIYFCEKTDLYSTLCVIKEATQAFTTEEDAVIGSLALSTAIYSLQQYVQYSGKAQILADFLKCLCRINIPDDFDELTSKDGWSTSAIKALGPSIRVFLDNYTIAGAIDDIDIIDGQRTLVTPYVMTMMQVWHPFWEECDNIESYRLLLPKDPLEINDKFYDFMSQYDSNYIEDNDIKIENEDNECEDNENIAEEDSSSSDFSDIIKRLLKRLLKRL